MIDAMRDSATDLVGPTAVGDPDSGSAQALAHRGGPSGVALERSFGCVDTSASVLATCQAAAGQPCRELGIVVANVDLSQGESSPSIAVHLSISPTTVKTHIQHLYAKLGVNDRGAAVATAIRRGLIS